LIVNLPLGKRNGRHVKLRGGKFSSAFEAKAVLAKFTTVLRCQHWTSSFDIDLTGYAEYAVRSVVYTRVHSSRFTPPFRLQPADIQTLIIVTPERRFESRTVYSVVKDPGSCRHVYLNAVGVFFKGCPTNCLIP